MRKAEANWISVFIVAVLLVIYLVVNTGCTQQVAPEDNIPEPVSTICDIVLTETKLKTIFYSADQDTLDKFYHGFSYACKFGITDKKHEDMYLATVLSEVGSSLIGVRENLNYSCEALPKTFSYYKNNGEYNTDGRCNNHAANQYNIGSKAYANRLGNGSVNSGDGYTYRGGGYAQTTGYTNYKIIVDAVNSHVGGSYTTHNFADNITNPYIANLGGMGYWLQVDANSCSTMNCVTDKWNYYTNSREKRQANYNWISGL